MSGTDACSIYPCFAQPPNRQDHRHGRCVACRGVACPTDSSGRTCAPPISSFLPHSLQRLAASEPTNPFMPSTFPRSCLLVARASVTDCCAAALLASRITPSAEYTKTFNMTLPLCSGCPRPSFPICPGPRSGRADYFFFRPASRQPGLLITGTRRQPSLSVNSRALKHQMTTFFFSM